MVWLINHESSRAIKNFVMGELTAMFFELRVEPSEKTRSTEMVSTACAVNEGGQQAL
jgi:hypothetical protein